MKYLVPIIGQLCRGFKEKFKQNGAFEAIVKQLAPSVLSLEKIWCRMNLIDFNAMGDRTEFNLS